MSNLFIDLIKCLERVMEFNEYKKNLVVASSLDRKFFASKTLSSSYISQEFNIGHILPTL